LLILDILSYQFLLICFEALLLDEHVCDGYALFVN
jgi:hypothetical protein